MSDEDPKDWLFSSPLDPKDAPRAVHLQRAINARKFWSEVFRRIWVIPTAVGLVITVWQAAHIIAERFPQP